MWNPYPCGCHAADFFNKIWATLLKNNCPSPNAYMFLQLSCPTGNCAKKDCFTPYLYCFSTIPVNCDAKFNSSVFLMTAPLAACNLRIILTWERSIERCVAMFDMQKNRCVSEAVFVNGRQKNRPCDDDGEMYEWYVYPSKIARVFRVRFFPG